MIMNIETIKNFIATPTAKLAATYLAIIMLMSISFSIVFYSTSARQLARPMPPNEQSAPMGGGVNSQLFDDQIREAVEARFSEARNELLIKLIWINFGALIVGAAISYLLARKSLRPIEEAMDAQTQFVSDASHELRTPLTVLQTTNEVALRKKKIKEQEARELLAHNIEEVQKLRHLSDSLLELLKNEKRSSELNEVALKNTVSLAVDETKELAKKKDIKIKNDVTKYKVKSDSNLLSRLIVILLDNAIKYSYKGGVIKIAGREVKGRVYIDIIDEGIGIKASDIDHIFRRFYRADRSRTKGEETNGYGLGLSIAAKIAKQLNHEIQVESVIGEGSTFTIVVPLSNNYYKK